MQKWKTVLSCKCCIVHVLVYRPIMSPIFVCVDWYGYVCAYFRMSVYAWCIFLLCLIIMYTICVHKCVYLFSVTILECGFFCVSTITRFLSVILFVFLWILSSDFCVCANI